MSCWRGFAERGVESSTTIGELKRVTIGELKHCDWRVEALQSALVVVRIKIGKTSKSSRMGNVLATVGSYRRRLALNGA